MVLTVTINFRAASSKVADSGLGGLRITSRAPAHSACIEPSTPAAPLLPVMMTIGVGTVIMISLVAFRPSMSGMWTSIVTRFGRRP